MIGFAVRRHCPRCRMELGEIALPPDVTALDSISCRSNRCRGRRVVFRIHAGRAVALTEREIAAIVAGTSNAA